VKDADKPRRRRSRRRALGSWPAILAPVDAALPDPEMASAIVLLMDGRLDGGTSEPVQCDLPVRPALLVQGKRDYGAASTRTPQASPLFDTAIDHVNDLSGLQVGFGGIGSRFARQDTEIDDAETPQRLRDELFHGR